MSSQFGKALAVVALVVATVAMGYTALQTRNLQSAFDRMAADDEKKLREMVIALVETEGHLARVRETMELLGSAVTSEPDEKTRAGALEGKLTATLTAAQREVFQQELKKWVAQLQEQREKGWAALREGLKQELSRSEAKGRKELTTVLNKNRRTLTNQLNALEKNLTKPSTEGPAEALAGLERRILKADENRSQTARERTARDQENWKQLFLALQESQNVAQRRYAELAARLDELQKEFGKPSAVAEAPPQGATPGPAAVQDNPTERERLAEFCAEVPQSALCRDL